ncbi:hypothetical protein [Aquimarina agarilytica]|uniref:hypothetical protein n=1 Tax=Aquimarina agarilytica TaxID=1087449 RepID=UPI000288EFA2|nr:hypothetical protein [Aquimarina agarilytica]
MKIQEERNKKETRVVFSFKMEKQNGLTSIDSFELPKHTKVIKGIQLLSDYPDRLFYRGKQRIEIGGEELFPDGFESKILMSSLSVAPRERFFELGDVLPGDLSVKIRFEDKDHQGAAFGGGYRVTIVLLIEEAI